MTHPTISTLTSIPCIQEVLLVIMNRANYENLRLGGVQI